MSHIGRFPFEPLGQVLARALPEYVTGDNPNVPVLMHAGDLQRASEVLGVSRRALSRWRHGQPLTLHYADLCATRLGLHPTAIWHDFNDICDRLDREAEEARRVAHDRRRERVRARRRVVAA